MNFGPTQEDLDDKFDEYTDVITGDEMDDENYDNYAFWRRSENVGVDNKTNAELDANLAATATALVDATAVLVDATATLVVDAIIAVSHVAALNTFKPTDRG